MRGSYGQRRGSGLIIALGVLAMLAIMAATFITLMRLDTRVTANYVDDLRCEMLGRAALTYFNALLVDDLNRTWGKYENRDLGVGWAGYEWSDRNSRVLGRKTYRYGTAISNDFWLSEPYWETWGSAWGGLSAPEERSRSPFLQQTFGCSWVDLWNSKGAIGRFWDTVNNREIEVWLSRRLCKFDGLGRVVHDQHPDAVGDYIDWDGDGEQSGKAEEISITEFYYDQGPFVLYAGDSYFHSGEGLTRESTLPGNTYWRWAAKLGVAHAGFLNLNIIGNLDGQNGQYLGNIGGLGLRARRAVDEEESLWRDDTLHLGRLSWVGFPNEYETTHGGFPRFYNEVNFSPSQVSMEKLFRREQYPGQTSTPYTDEKVNLLLDRQLGRNLVAYRVGGDGRAGDPGDYDRYRPGWRRDGATYYKFISPERALGDDRPFGYNDVMEHARPVDHPGTSAISTLLSKHDWRQIRPFATLWSTDTILRGKIWPTEGWLPWRQQGTAGDWRHIDILKRVNINIIGASGREGLLGEDGDLKQAWLAKRNRERDRLYFMLVAGMEATATSDAKHKACQFIASLADMVDRDQEETYYQAPDGSGQWALGTEKHPVINEVVFHSAKNAGREYYEMSLLRFELYNPMENIPWIPDVDEAIDISQYRIRVKSATGSLSTRLGTMRKFDSEWNQDGNPTTIGADGLYGYPQASTVTTHPTWSRYVHVGWGEDFPSAISKTELEGGLAFELWKPLYGAAAGIDPNPGKVETIDGVKCVCVDRTPIIKLVYDYGGPPRGPGGGSRTYVGCYRRWDPMNAKVYGSDGFNMESNLIWCKGWYDLTKCTTLGRPNTDYPQNATTTTQSNWNGSSFSKWDYERHFERNFKVVDGDLPSIGWLGELMMRNSAQDGAITWVHDQAQQPSYDDWYIWAARNYAWTTEWRNQLDVRAKFDLFRPFRPLTNPSYYPISAECETENLHMLDIFTVWDPSNDGVDNDGDGAVDDEDTGNQPGDRSGPEVRVFGRVDLNLMHSLVNMVTMPDSTYVRHAVHDSGVGMSLQEGRRERGDGYSHATNWGPFETIGDLLRADAMKWVPGWWLAGNGHSWWNNSHGPPRLLEQGFASFGGGRPAPDSWKGDDDGDGIFNERDERDMLFTWVSNYFTTRSNVFDLDLVVDICEPPYYPEGGDGPRKLPFKAYKSRRSFAQKRVLAILDRSTCLRIVSPSDGRCEFSGPVDVRMLRFTDDRRPP